MKVGRPHKLFVRSLTSNQIVRFPQLRGDRSQVRLKLLDFMMPNLLYNVTKDYNTIVLTENGVTRTITIPDGNYNDGSTQTDARSFWTMIITAFGANWTIVDNTVTAKWEFTYGGTGDATMTTTMYTVLGFDEGATITFPHNTKVISKYCYNFAPTNTIEVHTSLSTQNSITDNAKNGDADLFGVIPVVAGWGDMIYGTDQFEWGDAVVNGSDLESFQMRVTDDSQKELQLNGSEWFATFSIEHIE